MQINNLIKKKILFSLIAVFIFFLSAEIGARCYYFVKYRNASMFLYGQGFLINFFQKIKDPKALDLYSYLYAHKEADKIFHERNIRYIPLKIDKPRKDTGYGYPAYINKFGLRNKEIELTKPIDTTRIIALGASFVAGVGVDDNHTWVNLLEEELRKSKVKYEVINFGGLGSTINNVLISLIDIAIKFNPDYLIIFSAYNNHYLLKQENKLSLAWRTSSFLYNISLFYAMMREKLSLMLYKDNNYYIYNYSISVTKKEVDDLMRIYKKRLEQIYAVCNENNINLILGLQPEFIPSGLKDLQNLLDEKQLTRIGEKLLKKNYLSYYEFEYYMQGSFNLEMKKFAQSMDILLFDAVSIFPEDKYEYFIDRIHPNESGASRIAKALYSFLIKNNIVK